MRNHVCLKDTLPPNKLIVRLLETAAPHLWGINLAGAPTKNLPRETYSLSVRSRNRAPRREPDVSTILNMFVFRPVTMFLVVVVLPIAQSLEAHPRHPQLTH
jgi:hypothetical protein